MGLKTKIFFLDKGAERPAGMDEFLSSLREESVEKLDTVELSNGKVLFAVSYRSSDYFKLTGSSPVDGMIGAKASTDVHLIFDEDITQTKSSIINQIEYYYNGVLQAVAESNVVPVANRLRLQGLNTTTASYYQVVVKSGLPSLNGGRTLGRNDIVTWTTASS